MRSESNADSTGRPPPPGVRRRETPRGAELGATIAHLPTAGFFALFALIWNTVIAFMVSVALDVFKPESGATEPTAGAVAFGSVFLAFLVPFALVGLGAVCVVVLAAAGSLRVLVTSTEARVSIGVGPARWTRAFDPVRAVGVGEAESDAEVDGRARTDIVVDLGDDQFRFGATLRADRRVWMREALREELGLAR